MRSVAPHAVDRVGTTSFLLRCWRPCGTLAESDDSILLFPKAAPQRNLFGYLACAGASCRRVPAEKSA